MRNVFSFGPNVLATDCGDDVISSYPFKMLVRLTSPLLVTLFALILFLALRYYEDRVFRVSLFGGRFHRIVEVPRVHVADVVNAGVSTFLVLHVVVVIASVELFDCTAVDGLGYVFDAQPDLRCYEPWWWALQPVAVTGVVVWVFGAPLALAVYYARHRVALSHPYLESEALVAPFYYVGLSMSNYRRGAFAWELFLRFEQSTLAVTALFLSSRRQEQAAFALILTVFWLVMHGLVRPYASRRWNVAESVSLGSAIAVKIGRAHV